MTTKLAKLSHKTKGFWHILMLFALTYSLVFPQYSWAYLDAQKEASLAGVYGPITDSQIFDSFITLQGNTLLQINSPQTTSPQGPVCPILNKRLVVITAYSSTPEETDSSPFITASGARVRDGIIAANFLKIGTKVQIPSLYGDKVFVVEDRMARKNSHKVDIWMPSKSQALQFGVKKAEIVVLES